MTGEYQLRFLARARSQIDGIVPGSRMRGWLEEGVVKFSRDLKADPFAVGEGRETNDVRLLYEDPYAVTYLVDEARRTVIVADVRRCR